MWDKDTEVSTKTQNLEFPSSLPSLPSRISAHSSQGLALRMPRIQGSLRERLPAPPGARACVHGPRERALRAGARLARRAVAP